MGPSVQRTVRTKVPKNLNTQLQKLGLVARLAAPPNP